ncbi:hypothetical protein OPT61_g3311 [Boeremia exigua]|uniref:Uncharacterized protein n=1 Tax=Boeremia exigua TaxID=749465 RepID=A0ACC2IIK9_9PLEO|nr:hypothetical protein OPT61_g3311 [Boeremia exigua]
MASDPSRFIEEVVARIYQLRNEDAPEPLQLIRQLLDPWRESSNPSSLQPAVLERLNKTFVMSVAIDKSWDNVLEMLLSLGLQVRQTDMPTAIHHARKRHSFKALRSLFESGWDFNWPLNSHCPPAMSLLLQHRDFVETCLSMGAYPNTSSSSGHTTMQRAVAYAPLSTIELFVDHGATIADTNLLPHAALAYIDTAGEPGMPDRLEIIKYLIDHGASIDAFYGDTLNSDVPSGDYVYYGRMTALHFAIVGGKRDLVELFLEIGANPRLDTWSGWKTQGETVSSFQLAQMFPASGPFASSLRGLDTHPCVAVITAAAPRHAYGVRTATVSVDLAFVGTLKANPRGIAQALATCAERTKAVSANAAFMAVAASETNRAFVRIAGTIYAAKGALNRQPKYKVWVEDGRN